MSTTAESEQLIAASFARILEQAGPRQAEVLRRAAIPRWFDLEVLAALRERDDGNERVLDLLSAYSFVHMVSDGRYAYQDEVRALLLAEWRAQSEGEFRAINRRLADHFASRAIAPQLQDIRLPNLAIVVRAQSDWDIWQRESLYHRLIADPQAGLAQLRAAFDQAEASYRLADAEALLQTTADAQLDPAGVLWVRYMRARIERAALRLDAAVAQLEALLAEPGLEPPLAAEIRRSLGEALAETGQWVRAIELYRDSLAYFGQANDQRAAAGVMLQLGDAYRGVGMNTGGWYVPAFPQNPRARALGQAWYWLLALPFVFVAAFLRRTPWTLPRPVYLAHYQNWLLIRTYRTAQSWYARARAAFNALGDEDGTLRAEQHQSEILILFGYADQALARLNQLRARLASPDSYRRLWIDIDRASATIERGEIGAAQAILSAALAAFRALGDARGEAAALALQGRASADAGASSDALASYRASLARFRALRYTTAREQALHALRAWQRRSGPGEISQRVNLLLDQEPEKRYVARFPRSLLPLLQTLLLGIVPLALLLTAFVAPTEVVRRIGNSALVQSQMTYNLWNVLGALLTLGLAGLAVYTLVALALIFFIPLEGLEREQPDFLITGQQGISRYDYRGARAQQLGWNELRRWIRVDRRLWQRPMSLFSLAFLEAADGQDLRIDGITGWYNGLQRDIALHLRDAGSQTQLEQRGVDFFRSAWGALLLFGAGLLLLYISNENSWNNLLLRLLSPSGYAVVSLVAFSGILILIPLAYWFVAHPLALHRALGLSDRWPWVVGAAGLGAIGLAVFGGKLLPIDALKISLLLWGVYVLADALFTLFFPRRWRLGLALIVAALLAATLLALAPLQSAYYDTLGNVYTRLADYASAAQVPMDNSQEAQAGSWERVGNALFLQGRFREASAAYTQALAALAPLQDQPDIQQKIAVITFNRAAALRKLNLPQWQSEQENACRQSQAVCDQAER